MIVIGHSATTLMTLL